MPVSAPKSLNCPTCGAPLETDGTKPVVRCKFCQNVILIDALRPGEKPETAPEKARGIPEEILILLRSGDINNATRLYREIYDVSQVRARYAIEQIQSGNLFAPEAGFPSQAIPPIQVAPMQAAGMATAIGGFSLLGCAIPIFILLVVGSILAFALLQIGGPFKPRLNAYGAAVLLSAEQDALADVVTQFYNVNDGNRLLGRVSTTQGKLLWKSEPLPKDSYVDALRTDGNLVFYVNQDLLVALSTQDGSQVWQVKMPDKLEYGDDSLVIKNERLLAITQDRTLQAYNTQTGEIVWSRLLKGHDRKIRSMGNWVAILDYTDQKNIYSLIFLDPSDGSQAHVITPVCQAQNSFEDDLDLESGIIFDETENSLFLIYGFFDGCVQRYELKNGQMTWQYTQDDAFNFSMLGFNPILTESQLYFNYEHTLYSVNKQSGAVQILLDDPDYELVPLMLSGENLLVRARRTRGSERFELWGLNVSTGNRLWQLTLENSKPLDPPNEYNSLIDSDEFAWTWHPTAGGVLLLDFQAEPNQLVITTINLADGSSSDEKVIPFKSITGDFFSTPEIIAWQSELLYFSLDTRIYVLDISNGEIIMQFQ